MANEPKQIEAPCSVILSRWTLLMSWIAVSVKCLGPHGAGSIVERAGRGPALPGDGALTVSALRVTIPLGPARLAVPYSRLIHDCFHMKIITLAIHNTFELVSRFEIGFRYRIELFNS